MHKGLKTVVVGLLVVGLVMVLSSVAMAAEGGASGVIDYSVTIFLSCSVLAAALAMGLGTLGTAYGLGHATGSATNAIGRNPEAQGRILVPLLVGLAMTEAVAIYALVISLVILFANPLTSVLIGG